MKKLFFVMLCLIVCHTVNAQSTVLVFQKPMTLCPVINLKNVSNRTISGDSIVGGTLPCIYLTNCTNVRITHCKLLNSTSYGVQLYNCSNITIDSNYITHVSAGVMAQACTVGNIKVTYNSFLNMQGPYPHGQCVQFNIVNGPGNRITYNRCENIQGQCLNEDIISLYKSNGAATDPITVAWNWIRGGSGSTTGAGITLADQGGSNQLANNNIVINSGADGIQIAGGTSIKVISNTIYGDCFPWSHVGLGCGNYSGLPMSNITVSNNRVHWISGSPVDQWNGSKSMEKDTSNRSHIQIIGWTTNLVAVPAVTKSVLPTVMVILK